MKGQLESIFSRYGQAVTLTGSSGETTVTRAFLQPVRKTQEDAPITVTPLGTVSRQRWLYIGSGDIALRPGDRLDFEDLTLQVQQVQAVYCGNSLLYHRALLHPRKEPSV